MIKAKATKAMIKAKATIKAKAMIEAKAMIKAIPPTPPEPWICPRFLHPKYLHLGAPSPPARENNP